VVHISEFSEKNVLIGLLRTFGLIVSIGIFIAGFAVFLSGARISGNIIMAMSIISLLYQSYLSYNDISKIKYANVAAKVITAMLLMAIMVAMQ
jgi:hypothetical protein